ncbi:endonuclease domain-containing protein [Jatrophihabitans fulvus]
MSWTSLARSQAGLITRRQLVAAGVPGGTADLWLSTRRLEPTRAAGVYRVGGADDSERTPAWFATLSTRSPVSYTTAAAWCGMTVPADGLLHITRFDRRRLAWPAGVRVHRVALDAGDVTEVRGLPVTTRRVTALDCAGWLPFGQAMVFADRAVQQGWMRPRDIETRLDEAPGRWGNRQLRRILTILERGADAESERRLHLVLRRAGLTGWRPQFPVDTPAGRFRVDVAFEHLRLAIEVDGYEYHSREGRFQSDRTRQNALLAAGWQVLRFTWTDIVDRPDYVAASVRSLVAA